MQPSYKRITASIRALLIQFIMGFMYAIRAFLGSYNSCRYEINCMVYAQIQLETQPFYRAIPAIIKRVFSCHPLKKRPFK